MPDQYQPTGTEVNVDTGPQTIQKTRAGRGRTLAIQILARSFRVVWIVRSGLQNHRGSERQWTKLLEFFGHQVGCNHTGLESTGRSAPCENRCHG